MNNTEFLFWLQGHFELSNGSAVSPQQIEIIKDHIDVVESENPFSSGFIYGLKMLFEAYKVKKLTGETITHRMDEDTRWRTTITKVIKDCLKEELEKKTPDRPILVSTEYPLYPIPPRPNVTCAPVINIPAPIILTPTEIPFQDGTQVWCSNGTAIGLSNPDDLPSNTNASC